MATAWHGPNPQDSLCYCIEQCLDDWDGDPAYAECAQKLREVQRELDVLCESPGHRAAARAMADTSTGHAQTSEPAGT